MLEEARECNCIDVWMRESSLHASEAQVDILKGAFRESDVWIGVITGSVFSPSASGSQAKGFIKEVLAGLLYESLDRLDLRTLRRMTCMVLRMTSLCQ